MKATVDRKALKRATLQAKRTAGGRASLPALSHVRLGVTGDVLTVEATDLELAYRARFDRAGVDDGAVLVPVKALDTLLGKLKGTSVTFASRDDGGRVDVTDDRAEVTLRCGALEDWPALPACPDDGRPAAMLDPAVLGKVVRAASSDAGRPVLAAVMVDGEAGRIAATDSYRLVEAPIVAHGWSALLPRTSVVRILQAKPGPLTAVRDGDTVWLTSGDEQWSTKLVEGAFPNVAALWPDEHAASVTLETGRLVETADRVGAMALGVKNTPMTITPNGKAVTFATANREVGEVSERVVATVAGDAPTFAVNPGYLHELAGLFDGDDVTIQLRDALKPAVMTDGSGLRALLMPMRVT